MDLYCRTFKFGRPEITIEKGQSRANTSWNAVMTVGGRRIGIASAFTKKEAQNNCYVDVCRYLESCDRPLWESFLAESKQKSSNLAPQVWLNMEETLEESIKDLEQELRRSRLFVNSPRAGAAASDTLPVTIGTATRLRRDAGFHQSKSARLRDNLLAYEADPQHALMRKSRSSLPITAQAAAVVKMIEQNDVTILMAATGSGKTTQVPQVILDDWIRRDKGSACNIICTQPRRIAAISVADRISKERGQSLGQSVGYQGK